MKGEVTLWTIEAPGVTYSYFSTFIIRAPGCENAFAEHVALLEQRRGGTLILKWIRARSGGCQDHRGGADIVGAVATGNQVWFVLKGGETDPFDFRFVDPRGPALEAVGR